LVSMKRQDMVDSDYEHGHETWVDGVWKGMGKQGKVMAIEG